MTKFNANSVTIREVAKRASVSVATVSRYINRTSPVSKEAASRVQSAMADLKFVPHAIARRLATQRTNTIGLLLTDIQGDFFAPMLSGIENVTRNSGFDLLISSSGKSGLREALPSPIGPHNTDGLLVFVNSLDRDGITHYHSLGFPMVLIHQSSPSDMNIPCVTVENKAASYKIVCHLIEAHNRRRIAYLSGPQDQEDATWRLMGYRAALEAHHISFESNLVAPGEFDRYVAKNSIRQLIEAGYRFDGVFSGDDEAAVGVLEALHEAGKRVPAEVSVVGFDDQRLSVYLNPALTTVRAPTEQVGQVAAQQLVHLIQGDQVEPLILLSTDIIIRRSCGCL